jgi:hypothetical protein
MPSDRKRPPIGRVQDRESNKTHRFSHLDLFTTPSHALPECGDGEDDPLPTLIIAPLEAGGRPLLSPPNVPHLVMTLQHCVMVEERVIHTLFLDEVRAQARGRGMEGGLGRGSKARRDGR